MPQPYAGKVASLRQLIAWLTAEIGMLDQVAAGLLSGHEGYQAVQVLPGIGRPAPTAAPGGAARGSAARRRVSVAARCHQFAAGTLAGDLADPDVCVHLWPGMGPGAVEAFGDGLAAGLAEVAVDVELCAAAEAAVEEVEALAMLSPSAKVAPSTAPPAAVPMSGLVILTRFSFRWCPPGSDRTGPGPVCRGYWLGRAG